MWVVGCPEFRSGCSGLVEGRSPDRRAGRDNLTGLTLRDDDGLYP